ncbi:MAG: c-type cytochrome [Thermodesulfobacteriota bacterium]
MTRACRRRLALCWIFLPPWGWFAAGVIAIALDGAAPGPGLAQDPASIASGRREFVQYCAVCHGVDGKGQGPMARQLNIEPADLTQIRKKNGGEFPFWHVYKVIDGREEVKEKGPRVMPVWGAEFQKEAGASTPDVEAAVRERILNLVHYVQSIQK